MRNHMGVERLDKRRVARNRLMLFNSAMVSIVAVLVVVNGFHETWNPIRIVCGAVLTLCAITCWLCYAIARRNLSLPKTQLQPGSDRNTDGSA